MEGHLCNHCRDGSVRLALARSRGHANLDGMLRHGGYALSLDAHSRLDMAHKLDRAVSFAACGGDEANGWTEHV